MERDVLTSSSWNPVPGCVRMAGKAPLGPLAMTVHPVSWLLPLAPWGMRMMSSAVLLKKAFPWSGHCYPAGKD